MRRGREGGRRKGRKERQKQSKRERERERRGDGWREGEREREDVYAQSMGAPLYHISFEGRPRTDYLTLEF